MTCVAAGVSVNAVDSRIFIISVSKIKVFFPFSGFEDDEEELIVKQKFGKKIVRQSAVISSFCFALCYFSIPYICFYFIEIVHKLNMFFLLSLFLIACVVCQPERGPSANADPYMFPGDDNIRVVSVATANEDYPSPGGTTSK